MSPGPPLDGPLVVAYDGSPGARRGIEVAARMFPGAEAVVVHVAEDLAVTMPPTAAPGFPLDMPARPEDLVGVRATARRIAEEGSDVAVEFGLRAAPQTLHASGAPGIADAVLAYAAEVQASLVVIGARSHSGVVAAIIGSVSDSVVHRAERPVLVVPGPPPE